MKSLQFLYKVQPARSKMLSSGSTPEEDRITGEHFEYLRKLRDKGVVQMAGRTLNTDSSSFGIVIFNAASQSKAKEIMENDPAVRQHIFSAELFPFRIALSSFS